MSVRILAGDCRVVLPTLPAGQFQTVVTSPPYWGLRDYGVEGGIGLEPTLEEHVDALVGVFREVRRVLRNDGCVWCNLGDAYAGSCKGYGSMNMNMGNEHSNAGLPCATVPGLKPKDLMMMPARIALALQADGWWLRSKIIWVKPNPMPESVTDRPTSSYEEMFLLSKRARYFFDAEAVRVPGGGNHGKSMPSLAPEDAARQNMDARAETVSANLRNVWTIPTAGFRDAHFATFPPALVEPCIKAGTSEHGACTECGAPWVREIEVSHENPGNRSTNGPRSLEQRHETAGYRKRLERRSQTVGWAPACDCGAAVAPCRVLDPFAGSGTVGLVAQRLNRDAVLIELNPEYAEMSRARIHDDAPLLADVRMGAQALKEEE